MWPSLFHLKLSLTGEASAALEVQVLHAFGDDECTDITGEATAALEVQFLHAFGEDECTDITGEASAVVEVQVPHAFGEDECTDITGEASAAVEVQFLHAFGENECTDITCEGRKKREVGEDERRESTAAHGSVNFTNFTPTPLASPFNSLLPLSQSFRRYGMCMSPTGSVPFRSL
jgi:hypothetical protein